MTLSEMSTADNGRDADTGLFHLDLLSGESSNLNVNNILWPIDDFPDVGFLDTEWDDRGRYEQFDDHVIEDLANADIENRTYVNLSAKKVYADYAVDGIVDWTRREPRSWTSDDVCSWIAHVASDPQARINLSHLRGEAFYGIDGKRLCEMTYEEFCMREPVYGQILYSCLRNLLSNCTANQPAQSILPSFVETFQKDRLPSSHYYDTYECDPVVNDVPMYQDFIQELYSYSADDGYFSNSSPDSATSDQRFFEPVVAPEIPTTVTPLQAVTDPYADIKKFKSEVKQNRLAKNLTKPRTLSSSLSKQEERNMISHLMNPKGTSIKNCCQAPIQRLSKRRLSNSDDSESDSSSYSEPAISKRSRPNKNKEGFKGKHLWEFIRDLLHNARFNPHIIRWEDVDDGIFRIVQSKEVARLWGEKKGNSDMTYEKLSRALRFCRTAKYFDDVPKDRNLPKKLCFKFGPKAEDWYPPLTDDNRCPPSQ